MTPIDHRQERQRGWLRLTERLRAHAKLTAAVTLLVGAIPALYIGSFVARWGVEVPWLDDWEMAPLIAKAHTGELTFKDLFEQQEEARTFFPKLIFVLSGMDGDWDVRHEMMFSVVLCVLTALGIYVLLRRSGLGPVGIALGLWASALLIFSPAQYELWLFASGFPSYMPVLCILAALLALQTRWAFWLRFSVAALLAVVSTFTLAHGLLAWALTLPVYLAAERVRSWKRWLSAWGVAAVASAAIYFQGYRKPAHLPDFAPVISAWDYVQFTLAFLGSTFAYAAQRERVACAVAVGAVASVIFVAAALYIARRWKDAELTRRTLPWIALGLYSVCSAILATLGRVAFGPEYAISSRYVTFSLYLLIAAVVLVLIVGREIMRGEHRVWLRRSLVVAAFIGAGAAVHLYVESFESTTRIMHSTAARNRLARSAIVFSPTLDTSAVIKRFNYPDPSRAITRAAQLDDLGILRPRLVRSARLSLLAQGNLDGQAASGLCDAVVPLDDTTVRASGWASLNRKSQPADCVLLAYQTAEGEWQAFAMSDAVVRRKDIARSFRTNDQLWSGWTATFRRDAVPPGAPISAWAVDIDEPRLYRLGQNVPELKL